MAVISEIIKLINSIEKVETKDLIGEKIVDLNDKLFSTLGSNVDKISLMNVYEEFASITDNNFNSIKEKVAKKINYYQKNNEINFIQDFFLRIVRTILEQTGIRTHLQEYRDPKQNTFLPLDNSTNIKSNVSTYKIIVNYDMDIFIEKTFSNNQEFLDTEKEIFNSIEKVPQSKFYIHSEYANSNRKLFPYYPYMTLRTFLEKNQNHITKIDKMVMIKEIAQIFSQLHSNQIFHQNICSSIFFVNNEKDVYIENFAHNVNIESDSSKLEFQSYYRHPELARNKRNSLIVENGSEEDIEHLKRHDIYSFGCLMYEIVSLKSPDKLFGNEPRQKRIEILSNNFADFLFKNLNFDELYGIEGMKEIIEKCMKDDREDCYHYFQEIIDDIEKLNAYIENKEKIENRIEKAKKSDTYKFNLIDLVINYFSGNDQSYEIITSIFEKLLKSFENKDSVKIESYDDVIKIIVSLFGFQNNNELDHLLFFEECFDIIIDDCVKHFLNERDFVIDLNSLMKLSIDKANKIFPITTLRNFVKFNNKMNSIFLYFIAQEVNTIHLNEYFHGDLSLDSIGIYYNYKTKTFLPAIIPFYAYHVAYSSHFRKSGNGHFFDLEKQQRKDIKNFLKILNELNSDIRIPSDISSLNEILYILYNYNCENLDSEMKSIFLKNYNNYDYSNLHLNFREIYDIFVTRSKDDFAYQTFNYFFVENHDSFFKIQNAIQKVLTFSNKKIYGSSEKIEENDITNLLLQIKQNNGVAIHLYSQRKEEETCKRNHPIEKVEVHRKTDNFQLTFYSKYLADSRKEKAQRQIEQPVSRFLEIYPMEPYSLRFAISRYFNNLNPSLNFKVSIKSNNMKLAEIKKVLKKLNIEFNVEEGSIVVNVHKNTDI